MAGLMSGPLLAGFVVETFGYFELQCCLGEFSPQIRRFWLLMLLGVVSFTAGLIAMLFLGSRRSHAVEQQDE